ncbi:serine/threonine protein kinase [Rubripirellula sp.]|nr:serine/threonine protein kinase [Rubripirellula sp.]
MNIRQPKLPIAVLERIDDLCVEFEQKWQTNSPPVIEPFLDDDIEPFARDALLAELIVLEIDYRRRHGETPAEQEYLERFPAVTKIIHDAFRGDGKPSAHFEPPSVERLAELFPSLEIIELLGAGGMGAVYKARQTGLDRVVALKVLPEEFGHDVKFSLRFTREARTLAKLSHPNIVSLYEFGNVADTYYFLMEYVEGSTLRDIVKSGELDSKHALAIVPYLCDALQYAHDKGIVHRDIKPENILMSSDGGVKIADFGLSRIVGNETQQPALTATHQVMGTPRYMAPEQLEGMRNVDHRADIYSLGVVIYEMLTGELPIGRFAAPSEKVAIDVRLDDVVLRTLEKEPKRRYQRASHIKSDVQSIATGDAADLAATIAYDDKPAVTDEKSSPVAMEQQEMAGRLLLIRRHLMERIEKSLRPLFRGQLLQVMIGVVLILIGVQCWASNTEVPHRFACGLMLHVYGVLVISQAILVCTRIRRIDYSEPVDELRSKLDSVRHGYLRAGVIVGFAWWLMWIPASVAVGFDAVVLYPNSLVPSLVVGVIGFAGSVWLYLRFLHSSKIPSEEAMRKLSSRSLRAAYLALDEIEQAQIS